MAQIFAGLFVEGKTDTRFLQSVVQRTLETVAFECTGLIDIFLIPIEIHKTSLNFVEQILAAAQQAKTDYDMHLLCVHTDADGISAQPSYQNKIRPAQAKLQSCNNDEYCTLLTAIIPIQETEAWMLADTALLKKEIGTDKTDTELGIHRPPETVARPKEIIENAITIAKQNLTRKRRHELTIANLYLPIGQAIDLEQLEKLSSYQDFKENVRTAFKALNLLNA